MSFVAAATIGAVASVGSSFLASKSAGKATEASAEASEAQLEFEREKYADWKATYGGVEENLADYYGSLSPEYYAAQGLQAFQLESQQQLRKVNEALAQRGLVDSGIAAQTDLTFATTAAQKRADIRAQAPAQVREEQFRFLQAGLGLSPGSSMSAALSNQASALSSYASEAQRVAGQAAGQAIQSTGTALADYFERRRQTQAQQPTPPAGIAANAPPYAGSQLPSYLR